MPKKSILAIATLIAVACPSAGGAETASYAVRATVGLQCEVTHVANRAGAPTMAGIALGSIREYCNAASGYQLVVSYDPGSLRGAVLNVGEDQVTLDGSGHAVVTRETGPRSRTRAIWAAPGGRGFDTDNLQFRLVAG